MKIYIVFFSTIIIYWPCDVNGQLAAVFSNVTKTRFCATWSSWGHCIWSNPINRKTAKHYGRYTNDYLDQLSKKCQKHWMYKGVRDNYGKALNNFFRYLKALVVEKRPCGMCSYRQSCGYGGVNECHKDPFTVGRPVFPFNVAEQVCSRKRGLAKNQRNSCHVKPGVLKNFKKNPSGRDLCVLWPSSKVVLMGRGKGFIPPVFTTVLYKLKWSHCIPEYQTIKGRKRKLKWCRCCCWPYRPNEKTFKCEKNRQDEKEAPADKYRPILSQKIPRNHPLLNFFIVNN